MPEETPLHQTMAEAAAHGTEAAEKLERLSSDTRRLAANLRGLEVTQGRVQTMLARGENPEALLADMRRELVKVPGKVEDLQTLFTELDALAGDYLPAVAVLIHALPEPVEEEII